jgi:hypothetical protein
MKTKLILPLIIVFALAWGCSTSQRRATYNSLATVAHTTDAAVKGYLDLVIQGQISTNSVPTVARDYQVYQAAFSLALSAAQFNTNTVAPPNVVELSGTVINSINTAKGVGQ